MPFVFSLAAVLSVRRLRETVAERTLGDISRELKQTRIHLTRVRTELGHAADRRAAGNAEPLQGVSLHEQYARIALLQQAVVEFEAAVAEITARRTAQQAIYLATRRDRELLEEMEGRQRAGFHADALRQEQRVQDDLSLARRLRRR